MWGCVSEGYNPNSREVKALKPEKGDQQRRTFSRSSPPPEVALEEELSLRNTAPSSSRYRLYCTAPCSWRKNIKCGHLATLFQNVLRRRDREGLRRRQGSDDNDAWHFIHTYNWSPRKVEVYNYLIFCPNWSAKWLSRIGTTYMSILSTMSTIFPCSGVMRGTRSGRRSRPASSSSSQPVSGVYLPINPESTDCQQSWIQLAFYVGKSKWEYKRGTVLELR